MGYKEVFNSKFRENVAGIEMRISKPGEHTIPGSSLTMLVRVKYADQKGSAAMLLLRG